MNQTPHASPQALALRAFSDTELARQQAALNARPATEARLATLQERLREFADQAELEAVTAEMLDVHFQAGVTAGLGHLSAVTLAGRETDRLLRAEAARRAGAS